MSIAAVLLSVALVSAEEAPYVVLPVYAEKAPPQDPTLLRLTKSLAEAIHQAARAEVRVASREARDELCPEDGRCPDDVAASIRGERAVVLILDPSFEALAIRVYRGRLGVEREGRLACKWRSGAVECDPAPLAQLFSTQGAPSALAEGEVEAAFAAFSPKLERCRALDADLPQVKEAWVSFRVRPDGRIYEVRVDPRELSDRRGFACMATAMESLRIRKFSGADQSFRFSLLPEEKKAGRKK